MIPKIVHQTWKTKTLPNIYVENSERWKRMHPNYLYFLYDDQDLRNIVKGAFPEYLDFYDKMTSNIERVDFSRYVMMYVYGGIYTDLDTIPIKNSTLYSLLKRLYLEGNRVNTKTSSVMLL